MKRAMTLPLIVAASISAASVGIAEARTNALHLTCAEATAKVRQSGAVVFNTGPRTFERLVSSTRYCSHAEILEDRWIPTRDVRSCPAGYKCITRPSVDNL